MKGIQPKIPLVHVVPVNEAHRPDLSCCNAYVDKDGIAVHHSYDRRECYERVGRKGLGWKLQVENDNTLTDFNLSK